MYNTYNFEALYLLLEAIHVFVFFIRFNINFSMMYLMKVINKMEILATFVWIERTEWESFAKYKL